jgi:opacity protein-like surface antigen
MKNLLKASVVAVALAASANVLAIGPGLYVGGQLGVNIFERKHFNQNNQFGAGINTGYNFAVAPQFMLAPELGFDYLGNPGLRDGVNSPTAHRTTMSAANLLLAATYNVTKVVDVFAKAGATVQFASQNTPVGHARNWTQAAPLVALGAGYDVAKNVQTYIQYNHVFGRDPIGGTDGFRASTVDGVYVGVKYNFGAVK